MKHVYGTLALLPLLFAISCTGVVSVQDIGPSTLSSLLNDSTGSGARFSWKVGGAPKIRIAMGSVRSELETWHGEETTVFTNGKIITVIGECAAEYRDAGAASDPLKAEGKCGIDLSALPVWTKRFVRLAIEAGSGEILLSATTGVGNAPPGMAFVAAEDWPSDSPVAIRRDFAIDKYPASLKSGTSLGVPTVYPDATQTGILMSADNAAAATGYNLYAAKQGCSNRTAEDSYKAWVYGDGGSAVASYHVPTEEEFMAATAGCTEANCDASAQSLKGVGQNLEWTDSLATVDVAGAKIIRKGFFNLDGYNNHNSAITGMSYPAGSAAAPAAWAGWMMRWNASGTVDSLGATLPTTSNTYAMRWKNAAQIDLTAQAADVKTDTQVRCAIMPPPVMNARGSREVEVTGYVALAKNYRTNVSPSPSWREFFMSHAVQYPYVYVVSMLNDGSPGAGISYDLHIYDVTNKVTPRHMGYVGRTQTAAFSWARGNLAYKNNYVYSPEPATNKLAIFNVGDRANPSVSQVITVGASPQWVELYGNYAYVANTGSQNITVLDVSDPSNVSVIRTIATVAAGPATMAILNNQLLVGLSGSKEVEVFSLNDPTQPVSQSHFLSSSAEHSFVGPTQFVVKGSMLIVGHGDCAWNWGGLTDQCGISLFDMKTPSAPKLLSELPGGLSWRIAVSGNYLMGNSYYSNQAMKVYDISDATHPIMVNWNTANATGLTFSSDAGTSVDGRSNQIDFRQAGLIIDGGYGYEITGSEVNYSSLQVFDLTKLLEQ